MVVWQLCKGGTEAGELEKTVNQLKLIIDSKQQIETARKQIIQVEAK